MKLWSGRPENVVAAQGAFGQRLQLSSAARMGRYRAAMEDEI